MGKLDYKARTIGSPIVRDSLCAISALEDVSTSRDKAFLVGGMATQSYLPSATHRPTSDVDLATMEPLTYAGFKDFAKPAMEYLQDQGYTVTPKKGRSAFLLSVANDEGAIAIEFARRNATNMGRIEDRLQREFENTRKKRVKGSSETYRVSSPEDIITPKLVRSISSLKRNPDYAEFLNSFDGASTSFSPKKIKKMLKGIATLREEAEINIGDPRASERLRFASDLYDIRLLSEMAGINEKYFATSLKDWDTIDDNPTEREQISSRVLPT